MRLSIALATATTLTELNHIFANNVEVSVGCISDSVTVNGYEGDVSTDVIARTISQLGFVDTDESHRLADTLADKVFLPLKVLVEDQRCSLYKITTLTRLVYTPPSAVEFGTSIALKHAMCLGLLNQRKYLNG